MAIAAPATRTTGRVTTWTNRLYLGGNMPEFMDVHRSMKGVTPEQLKEAHQADLDIQDDEGVNFKHAWADPESGMVFCLGCGREVEVYSEVVGAWCSECDRMRAWSGIWLGSESRRSPRP
jgi:Protein of unknown function (DUF4242)